MQSRGAYMALSIITGLLMIVLGGIFLAQPGLSLASIIWLVGIFAIVYGVFLVIAGIAGRHDGGGWVIAGGVLAVIMGIVVLAWPAATSLAVLYIIAAWAIISGIADIAGAFAGGISGGRRVWLVILGLIGIARRHLLLRPPGDRRPGAALGGRRLPGGARRVPHHRRVHAAAAAAGGLAAPARRPQGGPGANEARAGRASLPAGPLSCGVTPRACGAGRLSLSVLVGLRAQRLAAHRREALLEARLLEDGLHFLHHVLGREEVAEPELLADLEQVVHVVGPLVAPGLADGAGT